MCMKSQSPSPAWTICFASRKEQGGGLVYMYIATIEYSRSSIFTEVGGGERGQYAVCDRRTREQTAAGEGLAA